MWEEGGAIKFSIFHFLFTIGLRFFPLDYFDVAQYKYAPFGKLPSLKLRRAGREAGGNQRRMWNVETLRDGV